MQFDIAKYKGNSDMTTQIPKPGDADTRKNEN